MSALIKEVKSFRIDTEEQVTEFIEQQKAEALEKGYEITSYKSTKKEKKAKGEIIDSAFAVDITYVYDSFWEV
jgi:hypothetical protein